MKITFLQDHRPKGDAPDIPTYKGGQTYDFSGPVAEGYAEKYVNRGLAVPFVEPAPAPEKNMTAGELLAAIEGDGDLKRNFAAFKALAAKILGTATPDKKADIVAALRAIVDAEPRSIEFQTIEQNGERLTYVTAPWPRRTLFAVELLDGGPHGIAIGGAGKLATIEVANGKALYDLSPEKDGARAGDLVESTFVPPPRGGPGA